MHNLLRPLSDIRPLRDSLLIAGFADQNGATPAATLGYLAECWHAQPLAEIDPEEFFDFTARRPIVRMQNDERVLQWPASRFYVASPPGSERDVVLLVGIEPHLRWRTFCEVIESFMHAVGATKSLTLGSYGGSTPHTRPVPVRLAASDEEYGRMFGLEPRPSSYEGPTGIVGVLNVHQRTQGFRTASLSAMTPFYVGAEHNPHAMIALIEAIDRGLGTSTPTAPLREQAAAVDQEAEQAVRQSEPLRKLVQSLEHQFDWIRGSGTTLTTTIPVASDLPSGDELVAGIEQFLRRQRDSEGSGSDPTGKPSFT